MKLARRTVLRGVGLGGLSIGLPTLDAMVDGRGRWYNAAGAATTAPVRFVAYVFPNGIHSFTQWTPPEPHGAPYTLTPNLLSLSPVKGDVNVVSGLRHSTYFVRNFQKFGDHARGFQTVLTGVPLIGDAAAGGPSVDQVIAQAQQTRTRVGSLQLVAYANGRRYINSFWAGPGQALPTHYDPQSVFKQVFGASAAPGTGTVPDPRAKGRRSVLDFVLADAAQLGKRVSAADRVRVEAHLASIREVERQLGLAATGAAATPLRCDVKDAPPAVTGDQMFLTSLRLAALALQCDATRVIGVQSNHGYLPFPWLGIPSADRTAGAREYSDEDHNLSHAYGKGRADREDHYARIIDYKVKGFATLVDLLKKAPDATGTLLDNTLMLCTADVGTGGHGCEQMPVLLAGRAGGALRTGVHLRYPSGTPLNRLLLTVARLAGARVDRFGMDGTEPLGM